MTLKQGKNNHTYRVRSIDIEMQLERRLEALGLTEGSLITILNNDKKDPLPQNSGAPASLSADGSLIILK